jgi:hypothetical protein
VSTERIFDLLRKNFAGSLRRAIVRSSATTDGRWKVAGHNQTIYSKATLPLRDRIAAASALAAQ